jgi:hypothetical protein
MLCNLHPAIFNVKDLSPDDVLWPGVLYRSIALMTGLRCMNEDVVRLRNLSESRARVPRLAAHL